MLSLSKDLSNPKWKPLQMSAGWKAKSRGIAKQNPTGTKERLTKETCLKTATRSSIISSFKDPLFRQLSEDVRIELRGENILNSKAEFSRCRVPHLKVDLEGWMVKKAEERVQNNTNKRASSQGEGKKDEQEEDQAKEADDSLEEIENVKRKPGGQDTKRRSKKQGNLKD